MPQRHDTAGEIIETTPPVCDGPSGVQFDLQKLGKYIRPKEYRLYKVRKKSAKLRKRYVFIVPNELIFSVFGIFAPKIRQESLQTCPLILLQLGNLTE